MGYILEVVTDIFMSLVSVVGMDMAINICKISFICTIGVFLYTWVISPIRSVRG